MTATGESIATRPRIQLGGADLSEELVHRLVDVTVDTQRSLPDFVELRFRDPDYAALEDKSLKVGAKLRVGVEQDAVQWLTDVEISSIELIYDADGTWTLVRGFDASHRLQRGRHTRSFLKQTVGDIARSVISKAGVQAGPFEPGPQLDAVIQPNMSDWEFLRRLAGDFGLEVVVESGRVGLSKPVSASGAKTLTLTVGESVLALRVVVSAAEQVKDVKVSAWDPSQKKALIGSAANKTSVAAIGITPASLAKEFGDRTLTVSDVPQAGNMAQLNAMATGFADQAAATFVGLEAVIPGETRAKAGGIVELANAGKTFDGKYVIGAARHQLGPEGYVTTVTVSGPRDATLVGLTSSAGTSAGSVVGLVPAIVTNNTDPDKVGRVKVKMPWLSDEVETDWARTVQMGGGGGGGIVIPEVDDEVLVGFEHGRLECPYVIGGLYNGKDKPGTGAVEDVSSGSVSRRSFADREGNRIELVKAGSGEKGIRLTTGDGQFWMYFDGKNQAIQIKSAGKVEIVSQTDLSLEATGNLTLKATGNITAEAMGNVEAKATGNFQAEGMATTIKAQTALSLQGSASAELKGGAATTISGAIVKIN